MTSPWISVLTHLFAAFVGAVFGMVLSSGKVKIFKVNTTVPYIKHNDRNFTFVVVLMVVAALVAVAITAVQGYVQGNCNQEFRTSLAERSRISTEDTALARQADAVDRDTRALDDSDRDSLRGFISELVSQPGLEPEERFKRLQEVDKTYEDNNQKRQQLDKQQEQVTQRRSELADERARNPVADPKCGS